jgi:hypothetical protein
MVVTRNERLLVIWALIGFGVAYALIFLDWQDGSHWGTPVLKFSQNWGLYTLFGVAGILFGVIAPLCLFVAAAFLALGLKRNSTQ